VAEAHRLMDLLEDTLATHARLQAAGAERRAARVLAEQLPLLEAWAGAKVCAHAHKRSVRRVRVG
jgi:hypothetical protein